MNIDEREMRRLIRSILEDADEEKKARMILLVEIVVEVLQRCPYLAELPKNEQEELVKILKEKCVF